MQAPPPKEIELHTQLVEALVTAGTNSLWWWSHLPFGEYRTKATAGKLKGMGVQRGAADFMFIGPRKQVFFLELKRKGGRASKEQEAFGAHVRACGFRYMVTDNLSDALDELRDLGITRVRVSA